MATPFQAWHAEALRLADQCEETALHYWQAIGNEHADALRALQEARAALSEHLLAVPMGEPVAWLVLDSNLFTNVKETGELWKKAGLPSSPLFTKPEGML